MPNRQVRISVAGKFQYTVSVSQDQSLAETAARAAEIMKLGANYRPIISIGQINFVPK